MINLETTRMHYTRNDHEKELKVMLIWEKGLFKDTDGKIRS